MAELAENQTHPAAWYVVHIRSRHEAKVEGALRLSGLETFLPRCQVPSRRRDRKLIIDVPLFPGYLFVHSQLTPAAYYDIIKLQGVVRILGTNRHYTPVPQETVDSIRCMTVSGRLYYPHPFLKRGMQVRIVEGPLTGIEGIIQGHNEKKRKLVISVELFRRSVAVELEDDAVEPVR